MKIPQLFFGAIFCGGAFFTFIALIVGGYAFIKTLQDMFKNDEEG